MNERVELKSFLGTQKPKRERNSYENYWILIGEKGQVIERENQDFPNRVLVLFDTNLDKLKLENHNPIKNTLWILESDLEYLNSDDY